jgi:diguanylate cyclase (GGDEF)-like protein
MLKNRKLLLAYRKLSYKLKFSFLLTTIMPLVVYVYVVFSYIIPKDGIRFDIVIPMALCVLNALIGFYVIKEVFDRIASVATEAKLIAAGDVNRRLELPPSDEVSDLGEALNQVTRYIRVRMDELKGYSEKTAEINVDIQKRVFILSVLLQISTLISQGVKLEDILKIALEKSRLLADSELAYLLCREEGHEEFHMKCVEGRFSESLLKMKLEPGEAIFSKLLQTTKPLIIDGESSLPGILNMDFYKRFGVKNTLAIPVFLKGRIIGILGIGNTREPFVYTKTDSELLDVFSKQIAIAIENDLLINRVKKLETKDSLTGLYNNKFIRHRLQEEIKRAIIYQRPCAFILLDIDDFHGYQNNFGSLQSESVLKRIASLIKDSVSEIDPVGRTGDNEFAIVLPEKNKRKAKDIAEEIIKKIESDFNEEADEKKRLTVSGGVSENPLDGTEAEELISKAKKSLSAAKAQGKNHIVS